METLTFKQHAQKLANAFELATRDNGQEFWRTKQDLDPAYAEKLLTLMGACHYDHSIAPNDWIYEALVKYADIVTNYDEADQARDRIQEDTDTLIDVYTHDLLKFLMDFVNHEPYEEFISLYGNEYNLSNGLDALASGMQACLLQHIANCVLDFLEKELEA